MQNCIIHPFDKNDLYIAMGKLIELQNIDINNIQS